MIRVFQGLLAFCSAGIVHSIAQTTEQKPLAAQPPKTASTDERVKLEAFTVTGSNIRRVDAEAALPVTVVDRSDIELRGGSTGAELFETLTFAEPSVLTESAIGSQGARGDVNSVDLRGLGAGSTLMLINGRRMTPAPLSMTENGVPSLAPNTNFIPTALVNRVEILRDGASAIYGADAAAGVINNLVSRNYEGRKLSGRMALTQHGGAEEVRVTASEGFIRGRTHVSLAFDYLHRDSLVSHDRKWASDSDVRLVRDLPSPWNGLPVRDTTGALVRNNSMHNGSTIVRWGQFQRGFINTSDWRTFTASRPTGNVGISTSTTPPPGVATMATNGTFYFYPTPAGAVNFKQTAPSRDIDNPERIYYANVLGQRTLIPRTDRVNFATFVDHRINDGLEFFGDLMYFGARSFSGREPENMQNVNEPGLYIPADSPWNPFGTRFYHATGQSNADGTPRLVGTPADVTIISGLTPVGTKARIIEARTHQFRILAGLRGRFGERWQWESGLLFSAAQTHEYEYNKIRESRLRYAISRTDNGAYNPFPVTFKIVNDQIVVDRIYENPPSVADPLYDTIERYARTKLAAWDFKTNAALWPLFRGGRIGVASGAEVRWESYEDKAPAYHGVNPPGSENLPFLRDGDDDFIAHSPNAPIAATQSVYSLYSELSLPFVTAENRKPLLQGLELSLAGRIEHFSIHGSSAKPKASLVWNPFSILKLRASYNESFRAPNLVQTSVVPTLRVNNANDPYRSEVTGALSDSNRPRRTFKQGNENLTPETAKSWVAGFVLDVPKVRGLSLNFDYWRMRQRDAISAFGIPATFQRDELLLDLATQKALAAGTPINQIDLGSGTANYQGYKNITRAPLTAEDRAAFAAFNARQPTAATMRAPVGDFVSLVNDYINFGGRDIEGYEIGFQYRLPRLEIGQFVLKGESTHYESTHYLRREDELDGITTSQLQRNGSAKWRANLTLSWRRGPWSAGWFANYFGEFASTAATTTKAVYDALGAPKSIMVLNDNGIQRYYLRVDPFITHNAYLAYRFDPTARGWLSGVSLRGGINNVSDAIPPAVDIAEGYQPGAGNPRGRQFTFEISRQF